MVNLKIEKSSMHGEVSEISREYPCGLCLSLDNETLKKLGFNGDLPEVGSVISFKAKAFISSTSENENESGEYNSMMLQITDMEISKGKKELKEIMYDKEED